MIFQIKKQSFSILLLIAAVLSVAAGCGKKAQAQPEWPSDIKIELIGENETKLYEMPYESMVYGAGDTTYSEALEKEEDTEVFDRTLSVMDIAVGDSLDSLLKSSNVTERHARLTYEYQAEDGSIASATEVYSGQMIDLDEVGAYDCLLMVAFCYEDGKWHLLDFEEDDLENHTHVIAITYDIQGPLGDYGAGNGNICGIFCEYY